MTLLFTHPTATTGPTLVAACLEDGSGGFALSGSQREAEFMTSYSLSASPGDTRLVAWTDENTNGEVDSGDLVGSRPEMVRVVSKRLHEGIDIEITRVVEPVAVDESLAACLSSLPEGG